MAELKTKPTELSVKAFLNTLTDPVRKDDCLALLKLMKGITKAEPVLWGPNIVGFGDYKYTYSSGRVIDWFILGFCPRNKDISVYVPAGIGSMGPTLATLGKHKMGKACLYINQLSDVDAKILKQILAHSANLTA